MRNKKIVKRVNNVTIGSVFVLILVGSLVRTMGAGMGCPDWPKCFGSYIPPASIENLPEDYLEIFKEERMRKNMRLSKILHSMGYKQLATRVINDPKIQEEAKFDALKAWFEYINRLLGVFTGLFVFLNLVFSFTYIGKQNRIPLIAFGVFVLTGFQGWVGSLVVSTNLLHGFITFHLFLALLILALLIWMGVKMRGLKTYADARLFWISLGMLVLLIPQLFMGTEVRGIIDDLIVSDIRRIHWKDFLDDVSFHIHRSYSWGILLGSVYLVYLIKKHRDKTLSRYSLVLLSLVCVGMLAGIGMIEFSFPFWMQSVHLTVATGVFGILFYFTLRFRISTR